MNARTAPRLKVLGNRLEESCTPSGLPSAERIVTRGRSTERGLPQGKTLVKREGGKYRRKEATAFLSDSSSEGSISTWKVLSPKSDISNPGGSRAPISLKKYFL
jgi:hypothetical protein